MNTSRIENIKDVEQESLKYLRFLRLLRKGKHGPNWSRDRIGGFGRRLTMNSDIEQSLREIDMNKVSAQHRRRHGGQMERPLPKLKKCRKMMLFPNALFLATTFPKIVKLHFYIEFLSEIFKFFSKFPNNLYFSSKRANN